MTDTGFETTLSADAVPELLVTLVGLIAPHPVARVEREHVLIDDLGYHSVALAELGFTVEDLFEFEALTPQTAMSLESVGDILDLVGQHIGDDSAVMPETSQVEAICARYGATWPPATA